MFGAMTCSLLVVFLTLAVPAQAVWQVGYGQSHTIASGAAAAANDDILLARSPAGGTWREGGFTLTKGVTVRGPAVIAYDWQSGGQAEFTALVPLGSIAVIENLVFGFGDGGPGGPFAAQVEVRTGTVVFRDCRFDGEVRVESGASAVFENCTLQATGDWQGRLVVAGHATLRDCSFRGADGGCIYNRFNCAGARPADPAITLDGGTLHAERLTAIGGAAFIGAGQHVAAKPALRANSGRAWLASGSLTGGAETTGWPYAPVFPAPAIENLGAVPIELDGVTLAAGGPGVPPFTGAVNQQASLVQLSVGPFAVGATNTATAFGDPGELLALLWAPAFQPAFHPLVAQPLWFLGGGVTFGGGVADGSGAWSMALAIPAVPALRHLRLPLQAIGFNGASIRASTLSLRLVD